MTFIEPKGDDNKQIRTIFSPCCIIIFAFFAVEEHSLLSSCCRWWLSPWYRTCGYPSEQAEIVREDPQSEPSATCHDGYGTANDPHPPAPTPKQNVSDLVGICSLNRKFLNRVSTELGPRRIFDVWVWTEAKQPRAHTHTHTGTEFYGVVHFPGKQLLIVAKINFQYSR